MANLQRILVVLSDNDRSKAALDHAQSLTAADNASLTVVNVNPYLDAYTDALACDHLEPTVIASARNTLIT